MKVSRVAGAREVASAILKCRAALSKIRKQGIERVRLFPRGHRRFRMVNLLPSLMEAPSKTVEPFLFKNERTLNGLRVRISD